VRKEEKGMSAKNYARIRSLSEVLFAGAISLVGSNPALARKQAENCLSLLQALPSETQEDVATSSVNFGDFTVPTFLYYDIALKRFTEAGISFSF
jgi:hypothetical protein